MPFSELGLSADVVRAVADAGYVTPTPIQAQAIPSVLSGRDILGCAQTGTGKTASFTLPMIDILANGRSRARMPRSLIVEPTRELAAQVAENFEKYGKYNKLSMALLIGGVSYGDQEKLLDRGVDVLIATPGRLLDHFERGRILLTDVKILVIDEADRMLDMGFIPDVERIVSLLPPRRQTLFFSATMPPEIKRLADAFLKEPKEISVAPPASPAATVVQHISVVEEADKRAALRQLIVTEDVKNAIVFCNRKKDVDILLKSLRKHGLDVAALHGDMAQSVRTDTLERFRNNEIRLLIASDVAARGLDVVDLSHVFNFDVPIHAEDYVHRIGRTGRAGKTGRSFTLAMPDDTRFVEAIEALIGKEIPRIAVEGISTAELTPADQLGRGRRRGGAVKGGDKAERPARGKSERSRGAKPERAARADKPERASHSEAPEHAPRSEAPEREWVPEQLTEQPSEQPTAAVLPFTDRRPDTRHRPNRDHERPERQDRDRHERGRGRHRRDEGDDVPVVAFGDHTPAFLLRPVKFSSGGD